MLMSIKDHLNGGSVKHIEWSKVDCNLIHLSSFGSKCHQRLIIEAMLKKEVQVSISSTFLRTNFSYKRRFGSFFKLHFAFGEKFVRKRRAYNVDEIDGSIEKDILIL